MKNKNPRLQTIIVFNLNNFAISNQFSKNTKKYKIKIVPKALYKIHLLFYSINYRNNFRQIFTFTPSSTIPFLIKDRYLKIINTSTY